MKKCLSITLIFAGVLMVGSASAQSKSSHKKEKSASTSSVAPLKKVYYTPPKNTPAKSTSSRSSASKSTASKNSSSSSTSYKTRSLHLTGGGSADYMSDKNYKGGKAKQE